MQSNAKPQPPQPPQQHWRRTKHFGGDELWGHELNIYQAQTSLLILQIDTLYLVGMANEQGNFVLPSTLLCSSSLIGAIFMANELTNELLKPTVQAAQGGQAQ